LAAVYETKRQHWRHGSKQDDNIKTYLGEIWHGSVEWIQLAKDMMLHRIAVTKAS